MANATFGATSSGNQVSNGFFSNIADWAKGIGTIAGTVGQVYNDIRHPAPVGSGSPDLIKQPTYTGNGDTTGSVREQPKDYTMWIIGGVAVVAAIVLLRK